MNFMEMHTGRYNSPTNYLFIFDHFIYLYLAFYLLRNSVICNGFSKSVCELVKFSRQMNQTPTEVQQNVTPSVRQRLDKRSFSLWRFSYPILQANKVPPRQAATTDGLRVGFATDFPAVASPHADSLTNSQPHTRPSRHTVNVSGCGPVCY